MSENVTFEAIVAESAEILGEIGEYYEGTLTQYIIMRQIENCYFLSLIVTGVPCNILALLILIRRRLWLHHEAYIYLAAVLIVNVTTLVVHYGDLWLRLLDQELIRLSASSDIICKFWAWVYHAISYSNWLPVLMLLNIYLRQQLIVSSDRRGCCVNLAAKYCTVFGTKVVISSLFTVCAVRNFWASLMFSLQRYSNNWYCEFSMHNNSQHVLVHRAYFWIEVMSFVIVLLLLLLVVWKRKRSSNFVFNEMNGATEDNGDAEVVARIVVCSAAVDFVIRTPSLLIFIAHQLSLIPRLPWGIRKVFYTIDLISAAYPLSTPIVCLSLKSRFKEELSAIVDRCCYRCCPRVRCQKTVPIEVDNNFNSVLQMDPIQDDFPVTSREEYSQATCHQI